MTASSSRPLSSLPAFPLLVALWFAALLGAGTFVLPAAIFESAAEATGLADIIPAAQPPLGTTARLAITAAAAVLGALIGLFVAWQVRRASQPTGAADPAGAPAAPAKEASPPSAEDTEAPTAWQVWREKMTEDAEDTGEDFGEELGDDPDSDLAHREDEADGFARADTDEDAQDRADPAIAEDDLQRAEADRLVAVLARLRPEDESPRAYDPTEPATPVTIPSLDPSDQEALSFRDPVADEDAEIGMFDSSFVSETPPTRDEAFDPEPAHKDEAEDEDEDEGEPAPEKPAPEIPDHAETARAEPTEALSLPELVARLELAIDALGSRAAADRGAPNARNQSDEVVSFPRSDAPRGDNGTPNADGGATDAQAMLRAALAKLDQVGSAS